MFTKNRSEIDSRDALIVSGLGSYSLADTLECGQCFRYEKKKDGFFDEYITVIGPLVVNVAQRERGELIFFELSDEDFEAIVRPYFALDTDLDGIMKDIISKTDSEWLKSAAEFSSGIAILKQEPWETLLSFIISQNNNIPRIRKIIREISAEYGVNICLQNNKEKCPIGMIDTTPCEEKCASCGRCYTFPRPEEILSYPDGLLPSHPGFRFGYMLDAAEKVVSGEVDLKKIAEENRYEYTLESLKSIKGVGDKVASCTALFGFANLEAFPIDVWMKRAIDTYFDGSLDHTSLGKYAGVAQQYIFHYIRNLNNEDK